MADKERYDTATPSYPPGVEQASNEAYIQSIITAMKTAGIVGASDSITGEQIAPIIAAVRMGVDTGDATATAKDIILGKTAYAKGSKVTGSMPTLTGRYANINVGSNGLITTTIYNTDSVPRYLDSNGSFIRQYQIPTFAGTTIMPGRSNQTIFTYERYGTDKNMVIKGDANLLPENIKNGVSIFGVYGTANTTLNTNYNDGITTQHISSSSGHTTARLAHMSSLSFTPKAAYVYLRDILPAANGLVLISTFIDASGRCIYTYKDSSNKTINVGSTCTWYGSSMANGALADIRIAQNLGFGGPYIAAIYG